VDARVQDLLEAADSDPPERIRPCDLQKLLNTLKLKKACGNDGITETTKYLKVEKGLWN
jgi:hypothetical protein